MKKSGVVNLVILAVVAAVLLPAFAQAGAHFVFARHTDAAEMQGMKMPETNDTTSTWLADGNARSDMADTASTIIIGETKTIYMLNHQNKTYSEFNLNTVSDKLKEKAADKSDPAAMMAQQMMAMMKVNMTVTPTEEVKKIGDWNCKKYVTEIDMGPAKNTSDMWFTDEIKVDRELMAMTMNSMVTIMPGFADALEEFKKMDGVMVKSEGKVKAMGMEFASTDELISYEEKDAPEGAFEIPEGYKKVEAKIPGM